MDKNTMIHDALNEKPGCEQVFFAFGMGCLGCPMARGENIEQAAATHGIDVDELLKALDEFKPLND